MRCHKCYDGRYRHYPWVWCSSCRDEQVTLDLPRDTIDRFNALWSENYQKCFVAKCARGEESPENIDDYIDAWHNGDSELDLYVFLGMNVYEFEVFIGNHDKGIHDAIQRRKDSDARVEQAGCATSTDQVTIGDQMFDSNLVFPLSVGDNCTISPDCKITISGAKCIMGQCSCVGTIPVTIRIATAAGGAIDQMGMICEHCEKQVRSTIDTIEKSVSIGTKQK